MSCYPSWRYHPDGSKRIIQSADEEEARWHELISDAQNDFGDPPPAVETLPPEPVAEVLEPIEPPAPLPFKRGPGRPPKYR